MNLTLCRHFSSGSEEHSVKRKSKKSYKKKKKKILIKLLLAAAVLIAIKCIITKLCTYFPTVSWWKSAEIQICQIPFSVFSNDWSRRDRRRQRPTLPRRHQHRPNRQFCQRTSNLWSVSSRVFAGIRRNSNQIYSNQDDWTLEKVMKWMFEKLITRNIYSWNFCINQIKQKSDSSNLKWFNLCLPRILEPSMLSGNSGEKKSNCWSFPLTSSHFSSFEWIFPQNLALTLFKISRNK